MKTDLIKPDFIIAGAPKTGTSSLARYLNLVQNISCVTTVEDGGEPHYFSNRYSRGHEWYSGLFESFVKENIYGEKSVSYMVVAQSAKRIKEYCPDVKLIFLLRNPVDRAYSQYKANIQRGTDFLSFESAIRFEKLRTFFFKNNYLYVKRGEYANYLKPYFELFPRENILILLTEELLNEPIKTLRIVCKFLKCQADINESFNLDKQFNVSKVPKYSLLNFPITIYKKYISHRLKAGFLDKIILNLEKKNLLETKFPKMKSTTRQKLLKFYKPHNEELIRITGIDISSWEK